MIRHAIPRVPHLRRGLLAAKVGSFAVLTLAASLLLAHVHPFGDAGLDHPRAATPSRETSIPPKVRLVLDNSCADCHSQRTRTPFYGHLAPISWLLERDILKGREHLNLDAWDTYSPEQQQTLETKILQQTRSGKMPLPQYRFIHRQAAITPLNQQILATWVRQAPIQLTAQSTTQFTTQFTDSPTGQPAPQLTSQFTGQSTASSLNPASASDTAEGSAVRGRLIFQKRCTGCHSLEQDHEGPHLRGVFGRTAGQVPGFDYSSVLKDSHIVWNEFTLDRWLTDPDAFVPGNNMNFPVPKPQERQDLIRFFKDNMPSDN